MTDVTKTASTESCQTASTESTTQESRIKQTYMTNEKGNYFCVLSLTNNLPLIERAKASKRYTFVPNNYWILGERAKENRPDQFDDNIHLMRGEELILTVKGTTHPGKPGLLMEKQAKVPPEGAPIWDLGWHYEVWEDGIHRGQINAFVQGNRKAYMFRDKNKNTTPDYSGEASPEKGRGLNFHPASYQPNGKANSIGTWSTGCVVVQSAPNYYKIYNQVINSGQKTLTFCVIEGDI